MSGLVERLRAGDVTAMKAAATRIEELEAGLRRSQTLLMAYAEELEDRGDLSDFAAEVSNRVAECDTLLTKAAADV